MIKIFLGLNFNAIQALSQLSYSPSAKETMPKTSPSVNKFLQFFFVFS